MKKTARVVALVAVVALGLAGCGSKPSNNNAGGGGGKHTTAGQPTKPPAKNANFKGCMVSDVGGFNDKSFNQTSLLGLQNAVKDYGIKMAKIQSTSPSEYASNINAMIRAHCNIVVTVGFTLAQATETAAKKNPKVDFAIVDNAYTKPPKNLKGLVFNTAQPAFLAGYLAAGMSKSKVVGTFGGQNIPPVTIYMDGFWDGVQYYNQKHHDKVQVIGWNEKTQNGTFTNDFTTKVKGQTTGQNMISQGADVLFPVAGADGLGALQAAKDSGGKVSAIWVDTDGCVSAPEYCSLLMTSAEKNMQVAVQAAIKQSVQHKLNNTPYVGSFSNGGVGLAPFHDWSGKIPSALQTELKSVKQDLVSGKIKIASPAIPK